MKKTMMVLAACCVGACAYGALNVLTLGAKNDGSADVSAIVNAHTVSNALFFPAGFYRVERPLVIKNAIFGEGYARTPFKKDVRTPDGRTWFLSALNDTSGTKRAVIEVASGVRMNVEKLNVMCAGYEGGIFVNSGTYTLISQVGIFGLKGIGINVPRGGSRMAFVQDVTIFGSGGWPEGSTGLVVGPPDCRLTNIEVMGAQIGLRVNGGYAYGDNLHLWTGCIRDCKDNGRWWQGTRGIVLGKNGTFTGSRIYPDTSFYALEQLDVDGHFDLYQVLYYDDGTEKGSTSLAGAFFHGPEGCVAPTIRGGVVAVCGSPAKPRGMAKLYTPGGKISNVKIRCDYPLAAKHLDRLCFGDELPVYEVHYKDKGFCKIADVFTEPPTGFCAARLTMDDGAAWRMDVLKGKDGKVVFTYKAGNALCGERRLVAREDDGMLRIYVESQTEKPWKAKFTTLEMCERFRPVDHANLVTHGYAPRYREVRPL